MSQFNDLLEIHQKALYQNEEEWKRLIETGHPHLVPFRESMLAIGTEGTNRCLLCYVPQQGYDDEVSALRELASIKDLDVIQQELMQSLLGIKTGEVDRRSKRNELFCNCCDAYIGAFPGGADVELPIMISDLRRSTETVTNCSPSQGAVLGLELRKRISTLVTNRHGYMLQDRGDGFMHSFPYGFAPSDVTDKKKWSLSQAVKTAVHLAKSAQIPTPLGKPLQFGVGLNHGMTYVGAPNIDTLPNRIDMILVLGSATATISARLSDLATAGTAVIAATTLESSGIDTDAEGWSVEKLEDAIVPAFRISS